MKKYITVIAFVVVGLASFMWLGRFNPVSPSPQNTGAVGALSATENLFDFGTISMKNGLVDHVFRVTNPSNSDISVAKIFTSCMCTEAYIKVGSEEKGPFGMEGMGYIPPVNEIIKAGESRDVRVVYDPNAHGPSGVGSIDRAVFLTDASGGTFQLEIKAVVTP